MVRLVLGGNTTQDCDGILDRRLTNENLLETTLKRWVLFDVLAVLIQSGCADHAELATGEHGLEHIARIHCPFRAATGTDDRVKLVDEGDDFTIGAFDLIENSLEAFLEFTAVLRTRNHPGQVKSDELLVLQGFGHVAGDDSLGQAFHDCGLTDAGLADENRIVLGTTREHLNHATNLAITTNHRVQLALACHLSEVATVLLQGLEGAFRIGAGNGIGAKLIKSLLQAFCGCAVFAQDFAGAIVICGQRNKQVLCRNVGVSLSFCALAGIVNHLDQAARSLRLGDTRTAG